VIAHLLSGDSESEPGITAIICALAGHPPQTSYSSADTRPRPVTCGCGQKAYTS
jgi:hypothetical protein